MTNLDSLPEELILHIASFLESSYPTLPSHISFHRWAEEYSTDRKPADERLVSLLALNHTCVRLYEVIVPLLYRSIRISQSMGILRLETLATTISDIPALASSIQTLSIPGEESDSPWRLLPFFFLPDIHILTIYDFKAWDKLEWEDDEDEVDENTRISGTSPVKVLRLLNCGAHEAPLAQLLGWPKELEELHYDANQGEWLGWSVDHPQTEWTCAAIVKALQPQKESLKVLTLSRPPLVHEGLFNGARISLHDFKALETLRIFHVFLSGWDENRAAWTALPPNLEFLEVFYDDTDLTQFVDFDGHGGGGGGQEWLLALAEKKRSGLFPNLKSVCVRSPEEIYNSEDDWTITNSWEIPKPLADSFKEIGVDLSVILGYDANETMRG